MRGGLGAYRVLVVSMLGGAAGWSSLGAPVAEAQNAAQWNDASVRALVARAIARRTEQVGDSALTDYQATARGYLAFLAQAGPGFPDPPKAVRVDELAVEVYWHAPDLSKQEVIGRRDTLLLPADVGYYSDRYGIIQNNFLDSIRLGDGRDVHDVPHPLSARGPADYDYAIADSLRIVVADRTIDVYDVRVRPRDPTAARAIGDLFLDRRSGGLVRISLTFTRAAILDHRIETLTVTLDNALIDGRYWLPHHQELEVGRTSTWLNYPVRGIIRTRWDICCYQLNRGLPLALFAGEPNTFAPPAAMARYTWSGSILDSLPSDVSLATPSDVRRAEATAHQIVRGAALARASNPLLSMQSISDVVRVDRVEGLALGAGVTQNVGTDWTIGLRGRYGLSDRQANGEASLGWTPYGVVGVRLVAYRQFRDAGDMPETSTLANSLAAQEFGADNTDPFDVRGVGLEVSLRRVLGLNWRFGVARETQRALEVHATPVEGRYAATIPALALQGTRSVVAVDRPDAAGPWGTAWRAHAELRAEWFTAADTVLPHARALGRGFGVIEGDRPFGSDRLVARASLGAITADGPLPPQEEVYVGGPTSGPGYPFHAFVGQIAGSLRGEWQFHVPAPGISLGNLGTTPRYVTLAPFVTTDYLDRPAAFRSASGGWYPAVGFGTLAFFDLLRIDVARGLGTRGTWTLWIDVSRDWWGVL
jgi:hypothetical protein